MRVKDPRALRYRMPPDGRVEPVLFHLPGVTRPTANPEYRTAPYEQVLELENDHVYLSIRKRTDANA